MIKTKKGIPIATNFVRIIHREGEKYVEFTEDQIISKNIYVPQNAKWRLSEKWKNKVYYFEYRTTDNVKIYYQKQKVGYANYKLNCYYIALEDLDI